jgi:methyl coenzyme M reductase beta subunit
MTNNDDALTTTIQTIIDVVGDDQTKIDEAKADAQMMIDAQADFGSTREQLMAEYIVSVIVRMNAHMTDWVAFIEANDDAINDALVAHINAKGW